MWPEYELAKKRLAAGPPTLSPDKPTARKQLSCYLETVILVHGHAWCMDVAAERRKMARLITNHVLNVKIKELTQKILPA